MTRMFFMTRGVAGCGKSTFIRENGLEPYTISSDKVRLMLGSPKMDCDGNIQIDQAKMKRCWQLIEELLEERFSQGATTILDATNLKAKDVRPLRNLAQKHRYRVYIIDFTDVPEDEIYRRNAGRGELARVPEHVIARMLNVVRSSEVPGSIEVVSRERALELLEKPYKTNIDPDKRKAVNVIGDVHGCATALAELMEKIGSPDEAVDITAVAGESGQFAPKTTRFAMPREDEKYIFVGDLMDRGLENAHVLRYITMILKDPRYDVTVLEGNHEKWLGMWAENASPDASYGNKAFQAITRPQLEQDGFSRKDARFIVSRLGQYLYFELGDGDGDKFLVTHGGLSSMPEPFAAVSTHEIVHGSGTYEEIGRCEEAWEAQAAGAGGHGIVSVHGHRNDGMPVFALPHVVELEGGVEWGRELHCVRIGTARNASGVFPMEDMSVENTVFAVPQEAIALDDLDDMSAVISALRSNFLIKEKVLANNISSFNFSRAAFAKKMWDTQTVKARGLFIDTEEEKVKARSYDKFFNVGERDETRLETLARTMSFPVTAYVKENGYLGICSDNGDGTLFCASKSTDEGQFAKRFSRLLHAVLGDKATAFADFLATENLSAVFEVIDPKYDYHIVKPHTTEVACF